MVSAEPVLSTVVSVFVIMLLGGHLVEKRSSFIALRLHDTVHCMPGLSKGLCSWLRHVNTRAAGFITVG